MGHLRTHPQRPLLRAPWYAKAEKASDDDRPQLHEYRGSEFMKRFAADLSDQRLVATQRQTWYQTNRLDGHDDPTLRLAIHDGFYLIATELNCDDRAGSPPDPSRVLEAWAELHPVDQAPLPVAARWLPGGPRKLAKGAARLPGRALRGPLPIARILSPVVAAGPAPRIPLRGQLVTDAGGRRHTLLAGHLPITDQLLGGASGTLPTPDRLDEAADALARRFSEPTPDADRDDVRSRRGRPTAGAGRDHVLWRPAKLDKRLGNLIQILDENLAIGVVDDRLSYTADFGGSSDDPVEIEEWRDWLSSVHFYAFPESGPNTLFRDTQDDYRAAHNRARAHVSGAVLLPMAPVALREAIADLGEALTERPPGRTPRHLRFDNRYHYTPQRIAALTGPWLAHAKRLRPLVRRARAQVSVAPPAVIPPGMADALLGMHSAITALRQAGEALDAQFADPVHYRRQTLLTWLERDRADIVEALAEQPTGPEGDSADTDQALAEQLPGDLRLIVPGSWIDGGQDMIRQRWRMLVGGLVDEWQAQAGIGARLAGGAGDDRRYQISVHARVRGDQGCEYLVHSVPSLPFHVASFYETRLMPPRPIPMPSLKDLKRAVRGAAMILPDDLNREISKLRFPDGEVVPSGAELAGRWIYVFSIPIVTVCAMILLMIMITILDFIFHWIPYAILRIPLPR